MLFGEEGKWDENRGSRGTKRKALGDHEGELQVREVDDPGKSISIVHCNVHSTETSNIYFRSGSVTCKYNHREIPQTSTINSQINMESEPASSGVIPTSNFPIFHKGRRPC
ncbi:hypothetical protein CEXT_418011 [Caerostris extrusa]|uniref:Uncharacterized protein n=1 Tax=Caerostris extrusa TaxID=172846 RepID=A0AAV4VDS4_CAEEX|nr:hypothetical protein CEXT_418011 [Caerostris extrusa]